MQTANTKVVVIPCIGCFALVSPLGTEGAVIQQLLTALCGLI